MATRDANVPLVCNARPAWASAACASEHSPRRCVWPRAGWRRQSSDQRGVQRSRRAAHEASISSPGQGGREAALPDPQAGLRGPLLIVGMTSLPSRLPGICETLDSLALQTKRPDRVILSLPRYSTREASVYEPLPERLCSVLAKNPWMEVCWVEDDGPGTKLLGALHWVKGMRGSANDSDVLMVLDDDHSYRDYAIECLWQQLVVLKDVEMQCCSFFTYFFRGLMVPQGADIIAFPILHDFVDGMLEYHREFVSGDDDCLLVDDLWIGMYLYMCNFMVVSLRDLVLRRGHQTVYEATANAQAGEPLASLGGHRRRDLVSVRAFDGLLSRLLRAGNAGRLERWGGDEAMKRLETLAQDVKENEDRIATLATALDRARASGRSSGSSEASRWLAHLRHLYRMGAPSF